MARKVNKNLVALGSAAVIAVYGLGLARTASPSAAAETDTPVAAVASITATPTAAAAPALSLARTIAGATPAATATPTATATPSAGTTTTSATTAAYRDGTYTGTGTSRFGNITVAVTIQDGAISGVTLTKVTTSYPASRIASLPGQVVARQSANVQLVSGATYSSQAFKTAVAQALAQAATGSARG
jgi:uncharacterized protein with FMN-binding domain